MYLMGAIESKIVVQESLKSLTNSSTGRGSCRWLLRAPRIEEKAWQKVGAESELRGREQICEVGVWTTERSGAMKSTAL